jgi:amino acid adenylation domain-containing protein
LLSDPKVRKLSLSNDSTEDYPRDKCVHQLVSFQASCASEAPAIIASNALISYGQLEARANRLAHYLQSLDVGPEVLVGLCLDRSIDQIVSALAILKAGGAYLPLDPSYPAQRLNFMLKDARAFALVTEEHLAENLSAGNCRIVSIDKDIEIDRQPSEAPITETQRNNLAYVIYTSGSTGFPKGVAITHESLLNLVYWHQHSFNVTTRDRATYMAGLGFDASVWELWPYLTAGASIYLPDESIRNVPESLRDWLVTQGITISFAPTPLAERLIGLSWPSNIVLRILLTGADTLHRFPSVQLPFTLVNNYGPTECAVVATSGPVAVEGKQTGLPTIGRPIANTQIHILNKNLEPVPDGDPGELFISGAGLARGYVNHPELTAQKFLPNPFDTTPDSRMYRTGDLARFLPDGQIAFIGRVDDQVKIRGFRIEPDEITSALNEHPAVQQSVVIARQLADGEKSLIAYIVPAPGAQLSESRLKSALRGRLPDYMVPATFVKLDSLPLSSNGKVDRSSLPAATAANTLREDNLVAPRTPVEERIAGILAQLLGLEQVGVEDNFFMHGGHSLLGTQVIARLHDTFGVDLSLRSIFDFPTVAGLAAQVEGLLVAQLEAMSEEDAQRALDSRQNGLLEGV